RFSGSLRSAPPRTRPPPVPPDRPATMPSNSPSLAPARKAATSACVYSSTGPPGNRELRIAISPPGRQATSTQLPLGLLCLLLSQLMSPSPVAGIPLYGSLITSLHPWTLPPWRRVGPAQSGCGCRDGPVAPGFHPPRAYRILSQCTF